MIALSRRLLVVMPKPALKISQRAGGQCSVGSRFEFPRNCLANCLGNCFCNATCIAAFSVCQVSQIHLAVLPALEATLEPYLPEVLIARRWIYSRLKVSGLSRPQKEARIYAVDPDAQQKRIAVDLSDRIGGRGNEEGLLAIEPTATPQGILVCWVPSKTTPHGVELVAYDPHSRTFLRQEEKVILEQPQFASNHNGGDILRLPDGTYLLGFGDGGARVTRSATVRILKPGLAASFVSRLICRQARTACRKTILWLAKHFAAPETWAFGLRNPWRFDLAPDGSVWIGDAGQNEWEEITIATPGSNHGWRVFEGEAHFKPSEGLFRQ